MVGAGVARDPEKPGVEPAGRVVGVAILQDSHEHLLHQVLGQRRVAGGPAEKVEHRTVVALEEFAEGVEFAALHGVHQQFVGHVLGMTTRRAGKGYKEEKPCGRE